MDFNGPYGHGKRARPNRDQDREQAKVNGLGGNHRVCAQALEHGRCATFRQDDDEHG
jgi:hypothetical protein